MSTTMKQTRLRAGRIFQHSMMMAMHKATYRCPFEFNDIWLVHFVLRARKLLGDKSKERNSVLEVKRK